jgi:hypothetical protein
MFIVINVCNQEKTLCSPCSLYDKILYHMPGHDMCELTNQRITRGGLKRNCEVVSRNSIIIFMNTVHVLLTSEKSSKTLTLKIKFFSKIYFLYNRKTFPSELLDLSKH